MTAENFRQLVELKAAEHEALQKIRFRLIPFEEIKASTTTHYRVKGLFPEQGTGVIWGAYGAFKSFWLAQAIARPDWDGTEAETPSAFPIEVSKPAISPTNRPDWPIEPAEEAPEYLVAAEPEEVTPLVDNMIAELAEVGEHDLEIAHEAIEATLDAVPLSDRAGF